jgi:hypothetical protein
MASAERDEPRYGIKVVDWFGRRAKVCMQNENGPCPILAIANVLSLRNELKLRSGAGEVSQVRCRVGDHQVVWCCGVGAGLRLSVGTMVGVGAPH